jgi:hypothetical protein
MIKLAAAVVAITLAVVTVGGTTLLFTTPTAADAAQLVNQLPSAISGMGLGMALPTASQRSCGR